MAHDGSRTAILAALFANLGIAIAKFVGFAITGSASLLAEGIHSIADTSNQVLLLLGGAQARQAATPEHPFGYGRARYFWSFVVALVLFSMGGLFAIYEGVEKLRHPHELESIGVAIGILVVAMLLESWSFRTAIRESKPLKGARSWWRFIRTSKNPELPVVLLEDLGALIGLALALVGVVLAKATDEPRWDAAGSLGIGILLVVIALTLAVEMRSLLLGESASSEHQQAICDAIERGDDVVRVIHMRTEHLGPEHVLVAAKVEFSRDLGVEEIATAIDAAEQRVRSALPITAMIYLEPAIYDPTQAAPA
jgi:cation diffusion facilitator family transporter